jgi:hypothetical protein
LPQLPYPDVAVPRGNFMRPEANANGRFEVGQLVRQFRLVIHFQASFPEVNIQGRQQCWIFDAWRTSGNYREYGQSAPRFEEWCVRPGERLGPGGTFPSDTVSYRQEATHANHN